MSDEPTVLHETTRRLRVLLPYDVDPTSLPSDLCRIDGVAAARVNLRMRCVAVEFDGRSEVRAAVLQCLARGHASASRAPIGAGKTRPGDDRMRRVRARTTRQAAAPARAFVQATRWSPALLALAAPFAKGPWRSGLALSSVALRALQRREALARDPAAVVLDSASLATLALGGQVPVVATSVLLRQLAESLSDRLVGQADELLDRLLPTEAARYRTVRESSEREAWWPLRALRAGDRIRLAAGDVVPLDGCVTDGLATLEPVLPGSEARMVGRGSAVAAGERLAQGTLELRAEADAEHSRLARLRAHLRHVIAARDPAGRLTSDTTRLVSLPLTAAALVYGFTQDAARAATMLQADPQQGLDLAQPLAREAALYALARSGLVASGLETLARLATARALVLQDSGVLACGRWTVDTIQAEKGTSAAQIQRWIARLADAAADESPSLPDRLVREWRRHGALLRAGSREVHLAGRARLRKLWGLEMPSTPSPGTEGGGELRSALHCEFAVVSNRRVIARVVLASAWRPDVVEHLARLRDAGFERIALLAEHSIEPDGVDAPPVGFERHDWIAGGLAALGDWLADVTHDGSPAVIVHTVLRDSVPPGSLGLAPLEAEAGPHGVLAGDPLATLLAARRLSQSIERRLRLRHGFAVAANAALMTASATRWLPPMAVTLMHHSAGLLLLLDSLRLEALREPGLQSTSRAANSDGAAGSEAGAFGSAAAGGDTPLPLTITDTPSAAVHDGENRQ
jgi:cation transport ATPase